jgi:hypothetical protein
MSDERLCVICNCYIDLDSPDVKVIARSSGQFARTTVFDSKGVAHIVMTKRMSDRRRPAQATEGENNADIH